MHPWLFSIRASQTGADLRRAHLVGLLTSRLAFLLLVASIGGADESEG